MRPTPTTAGDWHCALVDHLNHELAVHTRMQPMQIVVVECVASDGRASLSVRTADSPKSEARWRPHVSTRLFFADRSVGCRTCQMPVAR